MSIIVPLPREDEIQQLLDEAKKSPEGIRHRILRDSAAKGAPGILCSAFRERAYIKPHKHPEGDEVYYCYKGRYSIILLSADGRLDRCVSFPHRDELGCIVSRDTWHTLVVEKPSVILTIYRGVYDPKKPEMYKQIPTWAPPDDEGEQRKYMESLRERVENQCRNH